MTHDRGEVWWGPAPFKSSTARPWPIVSDERRPFSRVQCIVLALTTREYSEGIRVPDDARIEGGADVQSYVSAWFVTTHEHRDIDDKQGRLAADLVSRAIEALHGYTPAGED
jgi:mRNA-degrading endonuclease toxin of MazEF toxin-antitoxin module